MRTKRLAILLKNGNAEDVSGIMQNLPIKPLNSNSKKINFNLYIDFIGEFLHSETLTVEELNRAYKINSAAEVVTQLIQDGVIEELIETNPKEYQFKKTIPKGFEL